MSDSVKAEETKRLEERQIIADEASKKKREDLIALQLKVNEGGGDIDINMDIDSMPDCRLKYDIIVKRAKANKGKFEDKQFLAHNDSLGGDVLENMGNPDMVWKRMGEHQTPKKEAMVVFEDGVDAGDVIQGMLGDCYFLSAMAVLGSKLTRDKFIFLNTDDEFMTCGAFCIKFYEQGVEDIIIVDDFLPLMNGNYFPFTCTTSDPTLTKEIWPIILEKAYAKKYGSYKAIAGGLVDFALAEMTNGIPEAMYKDENKNLEKWWSQVYELYKQGNVHLGAGSPSHPNGDIRFTRNLRPPSLTSKKRPCESNLSYCVSFLFLSLTLKMIFSGGTGKTSGRTARTCFNRFFAFSGETLAGARYS